MHRLFIQLGPGCAHHGVVAAVVSGASRSAPQRCCKAGRCAWEVVESLVCTPAQKPHCSCSAYLNALASRYGGHGFIQCGKSRCWLSFRLALPKQQQALLPVSQLSEAARGEVAEALVMKLTMPTEQRNRTAVLPAHEIGLHGMAAACSGMQLDDGVRQMRCKPNHLDAAAQCASHLSQ
jgi:hypothetical protein